MGRTLGMRAQYEGFQGRNGGDVADVKGGSKQVQEETKPELTLAQEDTARARRAP